MSEKITYKDVLYYIKENSKCILLTSQIEYKNTKTKLQLKCEHGHIFDKTYSKIKSGQWCPYCSGKHKYTYDEVERIISSEKGYVLLSNEYKNCKQKLKIKCDKEHVFETTFDSFVNNSTRCPICNKGGNFKYNLKTVRDIFKDNDCELLATEYINCDTPLLYRCSCGNISQITLSSFKLGSRCEICKNKKIGNEHRMPFNKVKEIFEMNDCKLLSEEVEYENANSLLRFKCSCGNESKITLQHFQRGERCIRCLKYRRQQTNIRRYGYGSPSQNKNIKKKIRQTLYNNCSAPTSSQQKFIYNLFGGELNYPINNISLDIAFPDEKIYIEFDGSGHNLTVIHKQVTQQEFDEKEKRRSYALHRDGWKEIRIISTKDKLPTEDTLVRMLAEAREYLNSGHTWICYNIDESLVKCSQYKKPYNFGVIKKIKKF